MATGSIRHGCWICAVVCGVGLSSPSLASSATQRCICAPKLAVDQAFAKAEVVFLGRAIAANAQDDPAVGEQLFAPQRIWKGEGLGGQSIGVRASDDRTACGRRFELDRTYLIYARRVGEFLTDDGCSRSTLEVDATEDLAALGEPIWTAARNDEPPHAASQRAAPPNVQGNAGKSVEQDSSAADAEPPATTPLPRCATSPSDAAGTRAASAGLGLVTLVAFSRRRRAATRHRGWQRRT